MATKKTTSSKTTAKSSPARSSTAKKAPAPEKAAPVKAKAEADSAAPTAPLMTKKALFERVKRRAAGVKGRDLRLAMDAVLEELGAAIVEGDGVKIQPFGTLKVQRRKEMAGGDLVICKLRRKKPAPKDKDPLAEAAE